MNSGQPLPQSYAATITNDKRVDDVRMAFAGGNVKDLSVEPPLSPSTDRIPVTDADRRNVLDPMTSTLDHVGGSGDPVSPQACGRKAAVFDGRMRFDLRSEFKRIETVKAEKGYQGPVVVCTVYFMPDLGLRPGALCDPLSRRLARRRSLAGADLRHAGVGALSVLAADADRHRRAAGDRIHLGAKTAARRGQHENSVTAIAAPHSSIPVIHRSASLDSLQEIHPRPR